MKSQTLVLLTALFTTAVCLKQKSAQRLHGNPTQMSPEQFPWTNPFGSNEIEGFSPSCEAKKTFKASEFLLDDLQIAPPLGLQPYGGALKKILKDRPYPGSWDGIDPHGYDRNLLQMEYSDVPVKVREWIEQQVKEETDHVGLFAVFQKQPKGKKATATAKPPEARKTGEADEADKDKVVLFAPGALYRSLPLWAAEGSDCEAELSNISKYSSNPSDGGVVAWVTEHSKAKRPQGRDMEFTVTAQVLKKAEGKVNELPTETAKEEL
ncbi:hypothetical protein DL770_008889 [Monosporascus sp. CRB-9-2]|nr:hypothetical protein DL770_008889 [Monosporascus sp. CRB-9-2]